MRKIKTFWTKDDDAGLKAAIQCGTSTLRLSARYQRSITSIVRRVRELGMEPLAVKRLPKSHELIGARIVK